MMIADNDFNVVQSATVVRHTHNDGSITTGATMPPTPLPPQPMPMETQRDNAADAIAATANANGDTA
eukprot:6215670-Amphidinium_carterae.1